MLLDDILDWSISMRDPFLYLAICISIPSMLLYIAEIVTIVRHRQFHNSFYTLFVVRAIPDLLYVLDSYYCYRLTVVLGSVLYPVYSLLPKWMIGLSFFLTGYTFQSDNLATAFLLLNRLTAISMPLKHEKFWSTFLPLVALIVYGVPICTCWEMFKMDGILQLESANSTSAFFLYEAGSGYYVNRLNYLDAAFAIIFMSACILINIGTFVAYKMHFNQRGMNPSGVDELERKLLIYAIATFFGHVLIACLLISIYIASNAQDLRMVMAMYTHYPWVLDTGCVVLSSWLLLWAGDTFRHKLLADFRIPRIRFEMRSNRVDGTTARNKEVAKQQRRDGNNIGPQQRTSSINNLPAVEHS